MGLMLALASYKLVVSVWCCGIPCFLTAVASDSDKIRPRLERSRVVSVSQRQQTELSCLSDRSIGRSEATRGVILIELGVIWSDILTGRNRQ